jgi:hypothetical protein
MPFIKPRTRGKAARETSQETRLREQRNLVCVYRYITADSQIDCDIRRLNAALNDPPDVLII